MKKLLLVLPFALWCYAAHTETIDIHHVGVGQGDATLIIITNDKNEVASILIDAGNSPSKGAAVAEALAGYPAVASKKKLDMIIVSHLHSDHLGGIPTVMATLLNNGWSLGVVIDRAGNYVATLDSICYDGSDSDGDNDPTQPIPTSALVTKYNAYVNQLITAGALARYNVHVGVNMMGFIQKFATNTTLFSLTGNGLACNKAVTDGNGCFDWQDGRGGARNENDYSYSFLLQLGTFKYFTGGDIGGESPYLDLETPLLSYFQTRPDAAKFHFCGYKASHHGSEHSTNTAFVAYTRPTVTVVPSALRSFSGTKLPSQNTLARIATSSNNSNLYYTYVYNTNPYSGTVSNYEDVILKVDGSTFESNHNIIVQGFQRNKTTLQPITGTGLNATITCNKH
jgi:competence protein ComEC